MIDDIITRLQEEDIEVDLNKTELTIYFKDNSYIKVIKTHEKDYIDEDWDGNPIYGTELVNAKITISTKDDYIVLFPEDGEYKQIYEAVVDRVKSYFTVE